MTTQPSGPERGDEDNHLRASVERGAQAQIAAGCARPLDLLVPPKPTPPPSRIVEEGRRFALTLAAALCVAWLVLSVVVAGRFLSFDHVVMSLGAAIIGFVSGYAALRCFFACLNALLRLYDRNY